MTQEEQIKISEWFSKPESIENMTVQDQIEIASVYIEFLEKVKPLYEKYTMQDGKPIKYLFKM